LTTIKTIPRKKTFDGMKDYLISHLEYYLETLDIYNQKCEDCEKNNPTNSFRYTPSAKCNYKIYKKELDYHEYYISLKNIVSVKEINELLKPIINAYHHCNNDDLKIKEWKETAYDFFEFTIYNEYDISHIIFYHENEIVGIKPSYSKLYEQKPFYIPVDGFEYIIEYRLLFNKYFEFWSQ
jgi:hypothetical protein